MTTQSQDKTSIREPDAPHSFLEHVSGDEQQQHIDSYEWLAAALKTGFLILKVCMIILGIAFLFSNIYWVPEGYIAVHTRFGNILDEHSKPVRIPGGPYFALPFPVDNIIRIPTTIQNCAVNKAFWIENLEGTTDATQNDNRYHSESFRPGEEGSLITADKNLVQGVWNIHFKIDYTLSQGLFSQQVIDFIKNTGSMDNAMHILSTVSQEAVVSTVAQTTVSDFVLGNINNSAIAKQINKKLELLHSGLKVTDVSSARYAVPKKLTKDFQAVTQAESEKALEIEKAVRYRVSTLNELAGEEWEELLQAIHSYELAEESNNDNARQEKFNAAKRLLLSNRVGGLVTERINKARIEKTQIIEQARAAAERFNKLLPSYRKNPVIMRNQLLQDILKEIWASRTVTTYTFPSNQHIYLNLENASD